MPLMTNAWAHFHMLICHLNMFFSEVYISCPCKKLGCLLSNFWVLSVHFIFWIWVPYQLFDCKYILRVWIGLHSYNYIFQRVKVLNFDKVKFIYISFMGCTFGVLSKAVLSPLKCHYTCKKSADCISAGLLFTFCLVLMISMSILFSILCCCNTVEFH